MEDVAVNAFNAAFHDPRFLPLRYDEFSELELSLALLTRPSQIACASNEDLLCRLEPRLDGLIIADMGKQALFLPAVWHDIADPPPVPGAVEAQGRPRGRSLVAGVQGLPLPLCRGEIRARAARSLGHARRGAAAPAALNSAPR
jgi:hypothetical protein